jgi:hypothetical protein
MRPRWSPSARRGLQLDVPALTEPLCTNMWMTCVQRRRVCAYAVEMLGISLHDHSHGRAFTRESASRILCMRRKPELSTCHAVTENK